MKLNKDPESWARVKPEAVLSGSPVQAYNVLQMALQDIATLAAELEDWRRRAAAAQARRLAAGRKRA